MTPEQEYDLFLKKCKKEKIEPTPELFTTFQEKVRLRSLQLEAWQKTDEFKAFEKERIRNWKRGKRQTNLRRLKKSGSADNKEPSNRPLTKMGLLFRQ
jgi:hypothetical protein